MSSVLKLLVFIGVVLIGTGADIYAARIGVSGTGLHIGVAFITLAALGYIAAFRKTMDMQFAYPAGAIFFLLIGWSFLGAFQADDTELALITITRYLVLFATAGLLIGMAGRGREGESVLKAGIRWAIYILVATIAIDIVQPGTFSKLLTRPAGLSENPNGAAQALAMLFTMLILVEQGRGLNRRFIVAGVLAAAGMLATLSRGGFVMVMILVAATLLFKIPRSRNIILPIITFALLGIGILIFQSIDTSSVIQNQTTLTRLGRLTDLSYYTDTSDSRYQLAQLYFASASPIFGAGPGATALVEDFGGATHNTFLKLYWESGLVASILYTILIIAPLAWSRSWEVGLGVAILMLVSILTNYNMDNRLFFATVLLTYMIARQVNRDRIVPRP